MNYKLELFEFLDTVSLFIKGCDLSLFTINKWLVNIWSGVCGSSSCSVTKNKNTAELKFFHVILK